MDLKVKKFLADRKTVVNPNFQGLVDRIRKFENSIHNRRFGFANTEIGAISYERPRGVQARGSAGRRRSA